MILNFPEYTMLQPCPFFQNTLDAECEGSPEKGNIGGQSPTLQKYLAGWLSQRYRATLPV